MVTDLKSMGFLQLASLLTEESIQNDTQNKGKTVSFHHENWMFSLFFSEQKAYIVSKRFQK